jgi:hypothetical protein
MQFFARASPQADPLARQTPEELPTSLQPLRFAAAIMRNEAKMTLHNSCMSKC